MAIVKVGNYMNFCSKCGTKLNDDEINCNNCNFEIKSNSDENNIKVRDKSKELGIASLCLALTPYLIVINVILGNSFSLVDGYFFFLQVLFCIPIAIASLICAVKSSEIKKNKFATISFILFYIPLIIGAIFAIILLFGVLGKVIIRS